MSSSDTDHDPTLGPWNTVQCRSNTQFIFPLSEQHANGVVIALDIFPLGGVASEQGLFAFRNSVSNTVTIHAQVRDGGKIYVWYNSAGASHLWSNIVISAGAVTDSNF